MLILEPARAPCPSANFKNRLTPSALLASFGVKLARSAQSAETRFVGSFKGAKQACAISVKVKVARQIMLMWNNCLSIKVISPTDIQTHRSHVLIESSFNEVPLMMTANNDNTFKIC